MPFIKACGHVVQVWRDASVRVFGRTVETFFCSLEPEWAAAATEVKEQTKGRVKLAAVDATANQVLTGRYGVSPSARPAPCEITQVSFRLFLLPVAGPPCEGGGGMAGLCVMKNLSHFIVKTHN